MREMAEGELLSGKNRQFRLVKRIMNKIAKDADDIRWGSRASPGALPAEDSMRSELRAKGSVMSLVARLGRRPLKALARFDDLNVVRQVRNLDIPRLTQAVKCGNVVLDVVHRSIFQMNLNRILRNHARIAFVHCKFDVPLGHNKSSRHWPVRKFVASAKNGDAVVLRSLSVCLSFPRDHARRCRCAIQPRNGGANIRISSLDPANCRNMRL